MRIITRESRKRGVRIVAFAVCLSSLLSSLAEGRRLVRTEAKVLAPTEEEKESAIANAITMAGPKAWCLSNTDYGFDFSGTYVKDVRASDCNPKSAIKEILESEAQLNDKDDIQLRMSKSWCENDRFSWITYWTQKTKEVMERKMMVEKFGVRVKAVPLPSSDSQEFPSPTACRSGASDAAESTSHAYDITNAYALTYEKISDDSRLNPLPGLRHGIIGYLKPTKGIEDKVTRERVRADVVDRTRHAMLAIINAAIENFDATNPSMSPVSLNLLSKGWMGGDDDMIDLQRKIMRRGLPLSSQWNYGINFAGRYRTISGSYAQTNYDAMRKATQHVVFAVMSLVERNAMISPRTEKDLPEKCETDAGPGMFSINKEAKIRLAQLRNKLRIGYGGGDGTLERRRENFERKVNLHDELRRIFDAIGDPDIDDHERASMVCVLNQCAELLSGKYHCGDDDDCFDAEATANPIAGNDVDAKRKSILVAIEMLKTNVYAAGGGMDDKYRRADILRTISFAAFLGNPFWVNCKSGLDRTGIFAPVSAAYAMMLSSMYIDDEGSLDRNCVPYLAFISQEFEETSYLKDDDETAKRTCDANDALTMETFKSGGGIYILRELRKLTLEIATKQSLPISFLSTGTVGVKWADGRTGIYDQIVKFFLPNVILVDREENGQMNEEQADLDSSAEDFKQASGYRAS